MAGDFLKGRRGLITGVANDHSIAWGIAAACAAQGAELAFSFQGGALERRVRPLAESVNAAACLPCDMTRDADIQRLFTDLGGIWDRLDFVVHSIAFSGKSELEGRYIDTSRDNFARTLDISCYSFTALARAAEPLMSGGGSLLTLSYEGASRVMPSYNVMGVAKAALEASVRYLAADMGRNNIRVNALSAGPMRTLAGAGVSNARFVYKWQGENALLRRNITLQDVGGAAVYLLSDLGSAVTGEVHYVDAGYHAVGMANPPV